MTILIQEPAGGTIPLPDFLRYLTVSFMILQGWLSLTNYLKRLALGHQWHEYGRLSTKLDGSPMGLG